MQFKMNRLCELAGVPLTSKRGRLLRESKSNNQDHESAEEGMRDELDELYEDEDSDEGMREEDEEKDEGMRDELDELYEDEDMREMREEEDADEGMDDDEVLEIDEKELVQELRRARRIMQEGKKIAQRKKVRRNQKLQESQLKAVIDQEVKNIIKEMDLNLGAGWVYGNKKPKRSKKGYLNHGSFLKGMGFK